MSEFEIQSWAVLMYRKQMFAKLGLESFYA